MEICNKGHVEIVYDGWDCPMCEAADKINEERDAIEELKDEIKELKKEIEND